MSDETERDDTILGTALSRAVESQHPRETPYERSRLAARLATPARSAFWPALAAAATFLAAVGLAAFVLVPRGAPAEPSPTAVAPSPTPAATVTPTSLPTTALRVFFARDQLPPLGAEVQVPLAASAGPEQRVRARLEALATAKAPGGAMNMVPTLRTHPTLKDVRIDGDLVAIDYTVPNGDWGSAGSAGTLALIQQLVYTASEEAGIRRVLITENGGKPTVIDQVQVDHPATREDVFGYSFKGTDTPSIEFAGTEVATDIVKAVVTLEQPAGLSRLTLDLRPQGATPDRLDPSFSARLEQVDSRGVVQANWRISVTLPGATWKAQPAIGAGASRFDGTIRATQAVAVAGGTRVDVYVDDARPWRIALNPLADGTTQLFIEVGGAPRAVNKNIVVYAPAAGDTTGRNITLTGAARVFEASVAWRLKDARGVEVAVGHTTASIGTSPVWGTFTTRVDVPASVSGNVTLEVFHASPQDGSDQDLVEIPLTIR